MSSGRSLANRTDGAPEPRSALSRNHATRSRPHSTRSRRLSRWVIGIGVVAIAANGGTAVYDAWRAYRGSISDTSRELVNTARILAAQTAGTLQAVDVLLRDTADWYEIDGKTAPPGVASELTTRAEGLPWLLRLSISDAEGNQQYRSTTAAPFGVDISDRSYFVAQRDNPSLGLFVSEPIVTRTDGRAAIALTRRLTDGNGHFAGVVTGYIPLEHFQGFYRQINLGADSGVVLLREDGRLILREPAIAEAAGKSFPTLTELARDSRAAESIVSPIDSVRQFVAVASVEGSPLVVGVSRDEVSVVTPLRGDALRVLVRTLVLSLLGGLAIAALARQLRRVEHGEQALRESEERYALAMEAADEGHFDFHLGGGPSFVSKRMTEIFGDAVAAKKTTPHDEFLANVDVHPDDRPAIESAYAAHIAGETPRFEIEHRIRSTNGEWRWVHIRARCVRDAAGKPCRFVGAAADITDRKLADVERERLETRLNRAQKMEAVGTLAGGIAHDFNNILGAILGYGEMAQKSAADGSDLRRYIDNVMHAGARAKALVERILAFSRSGIGQRAPVNVQAVVEETLELLAASLPSNVRLEKRLDAGNVAVIGDATQLHQVVMNLGTNAVQAMPQGGVLDVSLERTNVMEPKSLAHGSLVARPYVRLTVRDTGTGIETHVIERMFDPFFTTKGVGEGTGLGLSLVHGIVADVGGAIDVASVAGKGTTFTIWLPASASVPSPARESDRELPRGNGEVVMLVDDEPALVALAEEMLAELGYEAVGYRSSAAALEAFAAEPQRFDLVLTDEMMPDITGTGLASKLKRLRDIPIILMTGYSDSAVEALARSAGVSEILRKPLQMRDIADSLARVLQPPSSTVFHPQPR